MRFFKKRGLYVSTKEQLADKLYEEAHKTYDERLASYQVESRRKDAIYWILDDYNIYRSPSKNKKSSPLWRTTILFYYIFGISTMLITQPFLYIFGKTMENTKTGYFFRAWESRL